MGSNCIGLLLDFCASTCSGPCSGCGGLVLIVLGPRGTSMVAVGEAQLSRGAAESHGRDGEPGENQTRQPEQDVREGILWGRQNRP